MQAFEVPTRWRNNQRPSWELRPPKLLCQLPAVLPGSHAVLISMLHKFCSRMQTAGWKLTLIEKPRPRPTALRREAGTSETNTRVCCSADLLAFRDHRGDRAQQWKANAPRRNSVQLYVFFFDNFFRCWSREKNVQFNISVVFLVVAKVCCDFVYWIFVGGSFLLFCLAVSPWTFFHLQSGNRGWWHRLQKPGCLSLQSSHGLFKLIKLKRNHR